MRLTPDDIPIIHAALSNLLHGDDEAWDSLTTDEVGQAGDLLARLEAKLHLASDVYEGDEDEDDDFFDGDDGDDGGFN